MIRLHTLGGLGAAFLLSTIASAQITYVDADCSTNTTLADGTAYTPIASTAHDDEWNLRPYANGGTILSSNDAGGGEDAPMLRTTISGLIPGLPHMVYGYFWGVVGGPSWRGRASVDTVVPIPDIQGYNTVHFNGSTFMPMVPLAWDSPVGFNQTTLGLTYDPVTLMETTGHFDAATPVMLQEGNRWLFEIPLGTFVADGNGEIWVFIDDLANATTDSNRTWYDGVGYEWAPFPVGSGCGSTAPQIGHVGQPVMNRDFSVTLSAAPANSFALLTIGFGAMTWNGQPLPLALAPFGFPGCNLNVSADINLFMQTDPNGEALHTVNLTGVSTIDLYWQWGVLDATGGLGMTPGLETKFHR